MQPLPPQHPVRNPFSQPSLLDSPLELDACQQIHFFALQRATDGVPSGSLPGRLNLDDILAGRNSILGAEAFLQHPAEIERIFQGATLSIYQAIRHLYCDRLGRSIGTINNILTKMAEQAGCPPIPYEAVWSICLYLHERYLEATATQIERTDTIWHIIQLQPPISLQDDRDNAYPSIIWCVLDIAAARVVAFSVGIAPDSQQVLHLAVYDALCYQRRPLPMEAGGLVWSLPIQITAPEPLPDTLDATLADLDLNVQVRDVQHPLVETLSGEGWSRGLQSLSKKTLTEFFDNYLHRAHGGGPILIESERAKEYRHLVGYNLDPALQLPVLRRLLPTDSSVIATDGAVAWGEFHYENPLLTYWPGQLVELARSVHAEATVWVYLDGEILCEASARELKRADGTYLPNRPNRREIQWNF